MTDKEIIIDGIAVRNCNFFLSSNKYCGLYSTGCRFVPNCHFKQLARKTQEGEELKDYARRQENQRETYYKEFLKKDKALEEIEHKIIHDYCVGCDYSCDVCEYKEILDIISKVKGENNE